MNRYLSFLKSKIDESYTVDDRYLEIYSNIDNEVIRLFFSQSHNKLNNHFHWINDRLSNGRYLADDSRALIHLIDDIKSAQTNLEGSIYSFKIDDRYLRTLNKCSTFLSMTYGSDFPSDFTRLSVIEVHQVFSLVSSTEINRFSTTENLPMKLIGGGSYANVYKFSDPFYDKVFAKKIAKKDLTDKEKIRFKTEFEEMKKLNSPYILDVYSFDDDRLSYVMEYADTTLDKFISKNNETLDITQRRSIVSQIFRAFEYLESKEILHRDISLSNVLLKIYDDASIVKVSDFGLVKKKESTLTSLNSEFKGSLNDPQLLVDGFANYKVHHEVYALTRLVFFVLTGKTNMDKISNPVLKDFIHKGVSSNKDSRFRSVTEMKKEFAQIFSSL